MARGLAALAVVIWHWQHFYYIKNGLPADFVRSSQPLYWLLAPLYEKGHIAVWFFFELSGFVFFWLYSDKIAERACSLSTFAVLRFARLFPLHLLMLLVVAGLQFAYFSVMRYYFIYPNNDFWHFLLSASFASHWGFERGFSFNGPQWTVSIEVGLYFIFFVAAYWKAANFRGALAIVAAVLLMQIAGFENRWWIPLEAFFAGGLVFHAAKWYFARRSTRTDASIVIAATLLWSAAAVSETASRWLIDSKHLLVLFLFPLTIAAIVVVESKVEHFTWTLRWLGDITYSSYLIHFPLQLACAVAAAALGVEASVFHSPWVFVFFLSALTLFSLLAFHFFERPMQAVIRTRLLQQASPRAQSNAWPICPSTSRIDESKAA